jgi:hypothetical protein
MVWCYLPPMNVNKGYAGKIDLEIAKNLIADHYDTYLNKVEPDARTLCMHGDLDAQLEGIDEPLIH